MPARAACAAHLQGKFSEMHDGIWRDAFDAGRDFSEKNIIRIARKAGVKRRQLQADIKGACVQIVAEDQRELSQLGARGTPSFFINGRFLSGAQPIDRFKALIDEELKKAEERIADGTPVEDYYHKWVLETGLDKLAPTP